MSKAKDKDKNKNEDLKTEETPVEESKQSKEESKESQWYYFYTEGCAWCKRANPIVDELINEGHEILKLDLADGDNRKLQDEIKKSVVLFTKTGIYYGYRNKMVIWLYS